MKFHALLITLTTCTASALSGCSSEESVEGLTNSEQRELDSAAARLEEAQADIGSSTQPIPSEPSTDEQGEP